MNRSKKTTGKIVNIAVERKNSKLSNFASYKDFNFFHFMLSSLLSDWQTYHHVLAARKLGNND